MTPIFDKERMKRFIASDKFLTFAWNNGVKKGQIKEDTHDTFLEVYFNTYVLGVTPMERAYSSI